MYNQFIQKGDVISLDDNKVFCGDCLEVMKTMEDNSVDVFFTSPPYNDSGTDNEDISNIKSHNTHKKYESVERHEDWFEWQCEVIDEALRITRKYVLYNVQAISSNRENVYRLIGHYADRIHDTIVWYKPNGTPTSTPYKISNAYELVLIIKPEGVECVNVKQKFYYQNVINQPINQNKEYTNIHRALMSEKFADEIIYQFTQEGDTVLDCFNGLGTTMLSCKKNNCKYIGIEISEKYCQETIKRYLDYDMGNRNIVIYRDNLVYNYNDIKEYIQKPQMSIFDI